jgi:hypothetical protein
MQAAYAEAILRMVVLPVTYHKPEKPKLKIAVRSTQPDGNGL